MTPKVEGRPASAHPRAPSLGYAQYFGIADSLPVYHAKVLKAILRCVAAEQARLDGRAPVGDQKVQVDPVLGRRCAESMEDALSLGTRMPLFWGGGWCGSATRACPMRCSGS